MSNPLAIFEYQSHQLRIEKDGDGNPLFCAKDVCNILQYANSRKALSDHCRSEGVTKRYTPTESGNQEMQFLDEGNLYRLIIKSNKPEASPFESWVCDEVLPSIRKTGAYLAENSIHQELLDTQLALIASQKDQIAYVKLTTEKQIDLIEKRADERVREAESKQRTAEWTLQQAESSAIYWENECDKAMRSKRPVEQDEAREILHKLLVLKWTTAKVAEVHYRSPGIIRKVFHQLPHWDVPTEWLMESGA